MTIGRRAIRALRPVTSMRRQMHVGQSAAVVLLAVLLVACSGANDRAAVSTPARTASGPAVSAVPAPRDTAAASESPTPPLPTASQDPLSARRGDTPSRVVLESLGIDLPVVSGDLLVPGNAPDYPLCDVAQYLTTYRYPGRPGTTTWIYGHARSGMFLPMLEASKEDGGSSLIGAVVDVYATGNRRYRYEVTGVHPHSTDRSIAKDVAPDDGQLVLQTSEGPRGTVPKLQVSAELVDVAPATPGDALPPARPRECFD